MRSGGRRVELHKTVEREACNNGGLRREVGVALDVVLELALAQQQRVLLHVGDQPILVRGEHLSWLGLC